MSVALSWPDGSFLEALPAVDWSFLDALHAVDWAIIAGYLVFALVIGLVFARRAGRSTSEFFLSGRNLPWWLAGTSMVATSFASDTPLLVTGLTRDHGVAGNWFWWSWIFGGMLGVFLLSRLWRRAEVVTDVELTEMRYSGRSAAWLRGFKAAYMALPINCITMAWVMVAMMKLLDVLFGVPPVYAVIVCVAVATLYCMLSGFWGVVVTDLVQFALAMGGTVALCVVVAVKSGGLSEIASQARAASPLGERVLEFFPRLPDGGRFWTPAFWEGPFVAFVVFITVQWWANKNADGGGVIVQRMSSAKNERHSLLATLWFNVAHYALRPWPWIIVALASIAVFPEADGEAAYPEMIKAYAPVGLMGVMIATFLAAFMSTIDTHLNLSSAYLVNDVYRRFVRRDASERHYVFVSRLVSVGLMAISASIALRFTTIFGLTKFMVAFSSGAGLVFILRWFWWRVSAWSEISAMIASGVIASAIYLFRPDLPYAMTLVVTVAGSTVVWTAVTFLTPQVASGHLASFYRKVRPSGAWGPIAAAAGVPPAEGLGRQAIHWLAGVAMVMGATLGIGKLLLGSPLAGAVYLALALAGGAVVLNGLLRRSA